MNQHNYQGLELFMLIANFTDHPCEIVDRLTSHSLDCPCVYLSFYNANIVCEMWDKLGMFQPLGYPDRNINETMDLIKWQLKYFMGCSGCWDQNRISWNIA